MSRVSTPARIGLVAVTVGALLVPNIVSPAMGADDDVVIIPTTVPLITQSAQPATIFIAGDGSIDVTLPQGESVAPQCFPIDGAIVTCIGETSATDPLQSVGVGGLNDFLGSDDGDHVGALGWIMREAIDSIGLLYDVPADGRIERYAGDQIRAYMVSRVLDIFDRSLYGIELTPAEQVTFDYFSEKFLEVDCAVARYAQEEYNRFMSNECGYRPPTAPPFVTDPVTLPQAVIDWCSRPRTQLETQFVFAPPIPSADEFQAWGVYRNAETLGLDPLLTGSVQQDIVDTQNAIYQYGAIGAVGATVGATALAGALVGASTAASTAIAGAIGSAAGSSVWIFGVGGAAGSSAVLGSVTTVAAIAAASVVAVVVIGIIVTAVAIVQLVAYEEVGRTVNGRLAAALASTDPFDLASRRAEFAGLELRENMTVDNLPAYRLPGSVGRILTTVVEKTSARYGGVFIPDTTTLWADNATVPSDFTFLVTDSTGTRPATSITIPIEGVDTTVRFSDGWVITDSGAGERAALSFPFVTPAGEPAIAMRTALSGTGFTVTVLTGGTALEPSIVDSIQYRDESGDIVTVSLIGDSTSELAGPVPSAVGPLTPGRTVILRPNPVDLDGTFELDRFVTGYDYSWSVVRHDASTNAWVPVVSVDGYDARFIPNQVGAYRASVLMRDTDGQDGFDDDVWGSVDFSVTAPPVGLSTLQLIDDGANELRVVAQLTAPVPSNDYTLAVTWPGSVDGDAPVTTSVELECMGGDPLECSTVNTSLFPELNDRLSYTLPHDAALAQGVTVTITDRFGGGLTQRFPINAAARPTAIAPLTGPAPTQPGIVTFTPEMVTLQVPVGYTGDPNYDIARIAPGTGGSPTSFGIVDPATDAPVSSLALPGGGARASVVYDNTTGDWVVSIRITATPADVGRQVVPLVIQQVTGARTTLPLTLDLVPASGDRFRGAVASSIDPSDFSTPGLPTMIPYVMGGKAAWGDYAGDVCVSLEFTDFPTAPIERCGSVEDLLDADGAFQPVSFRDFLPNGLRSGRYELSVAVPSGERSDETPIVSSFLLLYGPPTVSDPVWNPTTTTISFTTSAANPAVPVDRVECRLDGELVDCTDAARGVWVNGITAGAHTFTVDVTATGGNFTQSSLDFEVLTAVEPEPSTPPSLTLSRNTVTAGDDLGLRGAGFIPGETIRIELESDPILLTSLPADSDGAFSTTVTIPVNTPPGQHDVVARGESSDIEVRVGITVRSAADLPSTGAGPFLGLLLLAICALLVGLGILAFRTHTLPVAAARVLR